MELAECCTVSWCSELFLMVEKMDLTFKEDVWDEEEREGDVVLDATHAQVLHHAFDLCIADVGSVDVSLFMGEAPVSQVFKEIPGNPIRTHHEVQQRQDGNKAEVNLANHLLSALFGVVLVEVGLLCSKTDVRILVVVDFDVVNLFEVLLHRVCRCSVGGLWRHCRYQVVV